MSDNNILTKENILDVIATIQNIYLSDDIPWVIGYSGGKDSTAALQLVWLAISELPMEKRKHKTLHIISTDTLVESPVVAAWVNRSLDRMRIATGKDNQDLPFEVHKLIPFYHDSYWVNLIGKGYPFPRMQTNLRWCTDRLKIKPSNTFIQDVIASHGEAIIVIGTRKAESANRARTMAHHEKMQIRKHLSPNPTLPNSLIYSPIAEWSNDNVWQYLLQAKNPWGHSNKELLSMYRGASDGGECPLVISSDTPSCGKSRFGCWVCTLVEKDKSMAAMIQNDEEKAWMIPLLNFRNEIGDMDQDRSRRDFRRMSGRLTLLNNNLVHGPYKKEWREHLLRKLLIIQKEINNNGPEEFRGLRLITNEELREIRRIWLVNKHEFCDSLPRIYLEVTGNRFEFEDEFPLGAFGQEEWNELVKICSELYPEEELLAELQASLLDIEKRSIMISLRKGIYNNIEDQIHRSYYRNEQDAEEVARKKAEMQDSINNYLQDSSAIQEDEYELN